MKIWFPAIQGGSGTDVYTRRLADALGRHGITTEVTWFSAQYQFAPFLLRGISPPSGTGVIHANSWNGFAFKRSGIPLVVTEHLNVSDPLYSPHKNLPQRLYHEALVRRFMAASFQAASAITAVSHFTAAGIARTLGAYPVQVIHDWIDTQAFSPESDNRRPPHRPLRLLFVGNLSRRKGADLLTPVMEALGSEFELRFTSGLRRGTRIPKGPNMVALGRLTQDSELIDAYRQCDVLFYPSRFEGFGLPLVEAMACGKPVIGTNTSSLPEIVEDGVTGILCPVDDVTAFAAACRKLADNPEMLHQYGQAAERRVKERFSEDLIIPRYVQLYESVVAG